MPYKEIEIDNKKVPFRASATTPRLYRAKFKRDIFIDLNGLQESYKDKVKENKDLQINNLEIFENIAYIMAYQADKTIPDNINDWLDQFDMFSIYEVLPELLDLWGTNMITMVEPKKNED